MLVHPLVHETAEQYLSLVDETVPGLVEGLYLTGSAALGDFVPGHSDIDFVAVSASPATPAQAHALTEVHKLLSVRYPRPHFDGPYVTWRQLADDPAGVPPGPHAHAGRLRHPSSAGRTPVVWHTLARHGIPLRGPDPALLTVDTDPVGLARWTDRNLDLYWRPWWRRSSRLGTPAGLACLGSWAPAWGVLGVSRMHCTLATGEIVSKSAAGDYARDVFGPRWHRILDECLRIRRTTDPHSRYHSPLTRRRDALAYVDTTIEAAHRLTRP
ncbi:aminoglycoside adenylyltransferase domain-containing protein [Streptomyces sp. NPDC058045]|uniref:aminoglycoside adenylyltransferase domain-containing protein n=1 Tax=Streptomyces sp. NPDC058045 TaxID=3346311 RepID=UPI0036F18A40